MKIVVFNVGGALATYAQHRDSTFVIDIGRKDDFSPVKDFLLPLYAKKNVRKQEGKYPISQLIVSHPHKDHISDIQAFDDSFRPVLVTCPNDKYQSGSPFNLNWKKIDTPDDEDVKRLKMMINRRSLPLKAFDGEHMIISYLAPMDVEQDNEMRTESYTNNVSIVAYLDFGKYTVFLPGDLQKLGMKALLDSTSRFRRAFDDKLRAALSRGVDYLICPHHGLRSSFSTELFSHMGGGKTRKLNVVSEKMTMEQDNRVVDSRYSSADYCVGDNNLSTSLTPVYQRKTTNGHIFIDEDGSVTISNDVNQLIDLFIL